ncbi:GDSL-like lipase/acylhydrolase family protein [Kordia sp. SMS9]|uniref:SGNH/GDSL hydrolase family protein n=1 Tax=Kordia sp. SMS9 TaxID=2282170 RepID=UPI000E0D231C|nr:SGNH/GDSL hydrolase family protein [Kordia sp. SMS9]AXG69234.1 GDSL-like lipase/acylhydrolase family protein [Kordia sp. SMS9]
MPKKLKLILTNIAILLIGILLIELCFGGWFSSSNQLRNLGIIKDAKFEFDVSHLYDTNTPTITYTRDKFGLRGISTYNQPSTINILTVGGSTTDQRYLDDSQTWQEILEHELQKNGKNLHVSNAGVDGQSTYGHLKSTDIWFPKIEKLQPKIILFYVGINDFYTVNGDSKYDDIQQVENGGFKSNIKDKSALYNAYRKLKGMQKATKFEVGHRNINFSRVHYTKEVVVNEKLLEIYDEKNLKAFKTRIQKLIAYAESLNAIPIFMTQPTLHFKIRKGVVFGTEEIKYLEEKYAYNGLGYFKLLNKLNDAIREVSASELVIDFTNDETWNIMDFYDYFHMTPIGAKKLGKKIYTELDKRNLVK